MAKLTVGILVGVLLTLGCFIASRHLLSMTRPFNQEDVAMGSHSHMKLFVQDVATFHPGSFDTDTYHIWFRFGTRIPTAAEYFDRVDTAIRGSDWRLLERHNGFGLYASGWEKSAPWDSRLEIELRFDPQTRSVSFEERRPDE